MSTRRSVASSSREPERESRSKTWPSPPQSLPVPLERDEADAGQSSSTTRRSWWLTPAERDVLLISLATKILLFPAYRSTDFEVHRNWLAITYSLPLVEWYFDTTSEWTLDYPPFFAFFERLLALVGYVVDPRIVEVQNLGYDSWSVIAFQRTTVIVSEFVLAVALLFWVRGSRKPDYATALIIATSILLHPGLLIVDHIHFQYNGFLLGILLWSLLAAREGYFATCAALFATLLNFKHIFVYLAPPYLVFLLRRHCFERKTYKFLPDRVIELGLIVASICALSFGPFLVAGGPTQIKQIVTRLFPFQRGLNHAYWAANAWALVSATDRVLVKYCKAKGWPISLEALESGSRGLIGSTNFGVFPNITPTQCFAITIGFSFVYLTKLWFDPSYKRFLDSIVLSAMTSFLWGWHVHEKAVLLFLIPLSLTATENDAHYNVYLISTTAGVYSLFPLLIHTAETPIKFIIAGVWAYLVFPSLRRVVYQPPPNLVSFLVNSLERLYLLGFVFVQLYVGFIHEYVFPPLMELSIGPGGEAIPLTSGFIELADAVARNQSSTIVESVVKEMSQTAMEGTMEFLPLMLISVYCAIGIGWSWLRLSWIYLKV